MSWLFSQALVEEFLGDICSDGEPSAPLNGNPIQQAYLPPDRMTAFSRLSRFGMMFKPLTENRGEELLTSYLEAFRARTYQQQEKVLESTEQEVECGITWHESSEKYNQNMSSLKTAQPCVLEDLSEFSKTLPRSGMMQGGLYWEQPTSVLRTKEKECGLWPTPTVCGNYNRKGASATSGDGLATVVGGKLNPTWVEWLMGWPLGWTDLKPLVTDKSPYVPQKPSSTCHNSLPDGSYYGTNTA
jgi:hypothetical protein